MNPNRLTWLIFRSAACLSLLLIFIYLFYHERTWGWCLGMIVSGLLFFASILEDK